MAEHNDEIENLFAEINAGLSEARGYIKEGQEAIQEGVKAEEKANELANIIQKKIKEKMEPINEQVDELEMNMGLAELGEDYMDKVIGTLEENPHLINCKNENGQTIAQSAREYGLGSIIRDVEDRIKQEAQQYAPPPKYDSLELPPPYIAPETTMEKFLVAVATNDPEVVNGLLNVPGNESLFNQAFTETDMTEIVANQDPELVKYMMETVELDKIPDLREALKDRIRKINIERDAMDMRYDEQAQAQAKQDLRGLDEAVELAEDRSPTPERKPLRGLSEAEIESDRENVQRMSQEIVEDKIKNALEGYNISELADVEHKGSADKAVSTKQVNKDKAQAIEEGQGRGGRGD
jgi:hypothetical protein